MHGKGLEKWCFVDNLTQRGIIFGAVLNGPVAQLAEQLTLNQLVVGSSPTRVTFRE